MRYFDTRLALIVQFCIAITLWHVIFGSACLNISAADWPQLLGPSRNGASKETNLASAWSQEGPSVLWRRKVGQGFASPVVVSNRLVVPHRLGNEEVTECMDALTGLTIWKTALPTRYVDDFGFDEGPRATPTIAGNRIFQMSAEGLVSAIDFQSGEVLWKLDTKSKFGASKGFFGMACSPLVTRGLVLINIGGREGAGIIALNEVNGNLVWKSTQEEASYSSPVLGQFGSDLLAAFFTRSGLVLLQPNDGKVLATHPWHPRTSASVNAAVPLVIDQQIFLSTSYNTGAILLKWSEGLFDKIWSADDVLSNHYATSVHHQGHLYGFDGRQEQRPSLTCIALSTGRLVWREENIGGGTILIADGKLIISLDTGEIRLLDASPEKYKRLAQAQVTGNGLRAYPALSSGILYLKGKSELVAVSLKSKN